MAGLIGDDLFFMRPDQHIVPNPCGDAETNRNWDNLIKILKKIVTNNYYWGSLIAEIQVNQTNTDECAQSPIPCDPNTFRPLFKEDPANPMIRPTEVYNYRGLGVQGSPTVYIVFDPNDPSQQKWEIFEVDHTEVTVLSDATFTPGLGIEFEGTTIRGMPCEPVSDLIATTTARALYAIGLSGDGGCSIVGNEIELEVFSATQDATDYVEITFDSLQVLTDVYQDGLFGNIYGYYYQIYIPCVNLVGPDLLMYVDRCITVSGSG